MATSIEEQIKDKLRTINHAIKALGPAGQPLRTSLHELTELINEWCTDNNMPRWPVWLHWSPHVQKQP